ncbi:MAG: pyridoxal-dependent decarboxylase [Sphingomicrobium sp.]
MADVRRVPQRRRAALWDRPGDSEGIGLTDPANLRAQALDLERQMAPLEPSSSDRRAIGGQVLDHALRFLDEVEQAPSYRPAGEAFDRRFDPEFSANGRTVDDVLDFIATTVDQPGIATTSPRFMGYIPGGGLFQSGLGDLLAAVSNKYAGFATAGPGAVRIENACVDFLRDAVGFPEGAAGTLTTGGSIANLTAIVAAREALDPDGGGAIYTTLYAHYCVDKALKIAGRGRSPHRKIATDAKTRMRVDALREALERDVADGIRPWLIVASAGTIDMGAIEPLEEIAALAREFGAWFHIDGAYGGLFALCDEGRSKLHGIALADSIALDPHKTMFLPYGTGAVLVRNGALLAEALGHDAEYIRPFGEADVGPSPANLSIELTRHFRAMRLWLPLQLAGIDAFKAAQTEKLLLARYFHARLTEFPAIDPGPEPDLSVVAFRYRSGDAAGERLMEILQQRGRVMLSGTRIDGTYYLRAAILCFRTHAAHIDEAIAAIGDALATLDG